MSFPGPAKPLIEMQLLHDALRFSAPPAAAASLRLLQFNKAFARGASYRTTYTVQGVLYPGSNYRR